MTQRRRSTRWAKAATYVKIGVPYECPAVGARVALDCFYSLEHDQGSEGFVWPESDQVRCSVADRCQPLAEGRCPLTNPKENVLNEMKIVVREGERSLLLEFDDSVSEVGDPRPEGQVIWFGNRIEVQGVKESGKS